MEASPALENIEREKMNDNEIVKDFVDMLKNAATETGKDLGTSVAELEQYTQKRLQILAGAVGQNGFDQAVKAETHNVKMEAGLELTENADTADARLLGIISGGLEMAAKFLSKALGAGAPG